MKKAIVTGGAGFAGFSLVRSLLENGYRVACPVRPDSPHNRRLEELGKKTVNKGDGELFIIPLDMSGILLLEDILKDKGLDMSGCLFFHLAWSGERNNEEQQIANITPALNTVKAASSIGAARLLITGSQAEYGLKSGGIILSEGQFKAVTEDTAPEPVNSYGAAKTAALYLTKDLSRHLGLSWNWLRIFSLYGEYEHPHTMLSYLRNTLKNGEVPHLSSCTQYWDYLHTSDAARAFISVAERGREGEIYNIANGHFRPLREFTEIVRMGIDPALRIDYAPEDPGSPAISLRPDVSKLMKDTGWSPVAEFS